MCRLFRRLERRRPVKLHGDQPVDRAYFALLCQFHVTVAELGVLGVRVRHPGEGRIDFPARRNGRPVVLCWKVGQCRVGWWRESNAIHAEPRPVDEDGRWEAGDVC